MKGFGFVWVNRIGAPLIMIPPKLLNSPALKLFHFSVLKVMLIASSCCSISTTLLLPQSIIRMDDLTLYLIYIKSISPTPSRIISILPEVQSKIVDGTLFPYPAAITMSTSFSCFSNIPAGSVI